MTKRSIKPKTYTISKTIKLTEVQAKTLLILKKHGVNVQDFIREAIKEKINKEWQNIKIKENVNKAPF
jgi:hypothetical protein